MGITGRSGVKKNNNTKMESTRTKMETFLKLSIPLCDETAWSYCSTTHYYMSFRQYEAFGSARLRVVTEELCVIFIHGSHVLATHQSHEQILFALIITLSLLGFLSPLSFFDCVLCFCLFFWSV